MKLITILFCMALSISGAIAAETKVPLDRLNWSQSLPLNANITLNGGSIIGAGGGMASLPDVVVYQSGTDIFAAYRNGTSIDGGTLGSTVNSRVIRAAINATPENGSMTIGLGTYDLAADLNCTTGFPSYALYYWTALPVTKDIHIKGMGRNATVLRFADSQYSDTRPALIMYDYCPFSESGGDGVGPGHNAFSLEDITFDGNITGQTPHYHDGAGLFLSGSMRYNTLIRNVEFRYSPNHALYLGYNGGGWENHAVIENIYTHDNYGSSQIDNTEDTVINNFISVHDGYGFWVSSRYGLFLDGASSNSGHLIVNNLHIIDSGLLIGGYQKIRDDVSMRVSNLYIDSREADENGIDIMNCNNVTINDGKIVAGTADYAVSLTNATGITLDDLELRGMRGVVTNPGYKSDVKIDGCDINTTGDCVRFYGTGTTALMTSCDLNTSDPAAYLVNVQAGVTAHVLGCHGYDNGLIYVSATNGVLKHSGTYGLGLEAYGATSVADGGTIAHGLKKTPTFATATGSLAGTIVTVTAKDATNLTIDLGGVTTTQTVNWLAKY